MYARIVHNGRTLDFYKGKIYMEGVHFFNQLREFQNSCNSLLMKIYDELTNVMKGKRCRVLETRGLVVGGTRRPGP